MIPWEKLDVARAPGGSELVLVRRGEEYVIRVDGADLMGSRQHGSEEDLATLGCAGLEAVAKARVLVGGLGMGFTTRATLGAVRPDAEVVVAELVPAVVTWNRGPLAHLAARPLDDPRVVVVERDVAEVILDAERSFDAILLDVDNGPDALTSPNNGRLYSERGLARIARALRPSGVLAVWSAADDAKFTQRLHRAGFDARVEKVLARRGGRKRHVIWVATPSARPAMPPRRRP